MMTDRPTPRTSRRELALFTMAVVLAAANLRPAVTSLPPVLPELRDAFGLSDLGGTALVTLPVACFGVAGLVGARLGRRWGDERTIGAALAVVAVGTAVRSLAGVTWLFAGTALAACAVAIMNVLLSSLIKRRAPDRAGVILGAYMLTYSAGVLVSTGAAVPLLYATGSTRWAIGVWALLAVVGLAAWAPQLLRRRTGPGAAQAGAGWSRGLLRHPIAWQVTGFMGAQALFYYAVISFLPELLRDRGASPEGAGVIAVAVGVGGLVVAFPAPALAARFRHQGPLLLGALGAAAIGLAGLVFAPLGGAPVWALVVGLGLGASQAVALYLAIARTADARDAARLSALSQGGGYLLALLGPLVTGLLHVATGGWVVPTVALLAVLAVAAPLGWAAGRPRTLSNPGQDRSAVRTSSAS